MSLLSRMTRNLTLAIPVTMLLGLAYGLVAPSDWLRTLIVPLTLLMVYPMMVNLKLSKLFEGGDIKAQLLAQGINFAIIPFIAFGLGRLWFPEQPYLALGLLLAALLPTSGMTIAWTGFAKGNLAAAVKMTVAGLILGSLATPFYVQWLMGTAVTVDLVAVFLQIVLVVFLPMLVGQLTQAYLIHRHGQQGYQRDWAPKFPPLSTLGVLGIVFVAIALKGSALVAEPAMLLDILVPLLVLYSVNFMLSTLVARRLLPRGDAIALVYGTVMRNLSIALALAMNAFGEAGADAALLVAVAYIIQVQSAAWYVKFSERFFGPSEA
ncbi:arsenic resistance protein [Halomonas halodenitrificans]|uniref:arsenic resistance protein n=1 Tax=Halomonas halodenitrificans TaxID=28252 RepID=UPI001B802D11|nr:bile acid:sodium symporter [Halomonas halodenitrificans]